MHIRSWVLASLAFTSVIACNSCSTGNKNGTTASSGFLWVATQGDQMVSSYTVDLSNGGLSKVGSSVGTGVTPTAIAVTPDGKALFIANKDDNTISSYNISSDGSLSAGTSTAVPGLTPTALTMDPGGNALFVTNQGSGTVSVFTISGTSLTAATVNSAPAPCTLENSSSFLSNPNTNSFVVNSNNTAALTSYSLTANVATLVISPANPNLVGCKSVAIGGVAAPDSFLNGVWNVVGTPTSTQVTLSITHPNVGITPISGTAAQLVPNPEPVELVTSASGGFLYVANQLDSTITGFSYSAGSGNVSIGGQLPNSPYAVGANPSGLAFARVPTNSNRDNYLIVSNTGPGQVSVFNACVGVTLTCGTPTGLLTPVPGSPFPANGTAPTKVIVDPQFDWVYVIDNKSNQISQFGFAGATGALSPLVPPTASTGSSPVSAGVTSDGNWVYVANNGASNLSALKVDSQGKLSPANPATIILSNQPSAIAVR